VLHYDLALDWKPGARTLTGTARLTVRAARPIRRVKLDFGRALKVDEVTVDGTRARATRKHDDLTIPLAEPLGADEGTVVTVRYHGRPKPVDSKQRRKDISMLGFRIGSGGRAWALQEPFGAFTWFPVNDHPSDEALYDVAITVPKGWSGVAHGTYQTSTTARDHAARDQGAARRPEVLGHDQGLAPGAPQHHPGQGRVREVDQPAHGPELHETHQHVAGLEDHAALTNPRE
jgi:aminopeptidase N